MSDLALTLACEATDATDTDSYLIELAAVVLRDGLVTGEQFHTLTQPPVPIPASGTLVHGHSNDSLARCPAWGDIAPHWLRFARGAQIIVWNARFHLDCLDRALLREGHRQMQVVAGGITDLKNLYGGTRRGELMQQHGLALAQEALKPQSEALQLARLWLALGRPL